MEHSFFYKERLRELSLFSLEKRQRRRLHQCLSLFEEVSEDEPGSAGWCPAIGQEATGRK